MITLANLSKAREQVALAVEYGFSYIFIQIPEQGAWATIPLESAREAILVLESIQVPAE